MFVCAAHLLQLSNDFSCHLRDVPLHAHFREFFFGLLYAEKIWHVFTFMALVEKFL